MRRRLVRTAKFSRKRRGVSAVEVVTATAVGVPMAAGIFFLARAGSKAFLEMASVIIGWTHL